MRVEGNGLAADFFRTLDSAGFDLTDEAGRQWGMVAYNSALAVWHAYRGSLRTPVREKVGRNDPCPCGSGLKYKRCCINTREESKGSHSPIEGFDSRIIPRLGNDDGILEEFAVLSKILEQDGELSQIQFSLSSVERFMEQHGRILNRFKNEESYNKRIDELAVKYIAESGEKRVLKDLAQKLLKAAPRMKSTEELRALAAGFFFAELGESKDPKDNLLGVLIFRRALSQIVIPQLAFAKLKEKFDSVNVNGNLSPKDPHFNEAAGKFIEELGDEEKEALYNYFERQEDELWQVVLSERFPVLLPFVTILPVWAKLIDSAFREKNAARKELKEVLDSVSGSILEEDGLVYGKLLEEWLSENKRRNDDVARAVRSMVGLCSLGTWKPFFKPLLLCNLKRDALIATSDREREIIAEFFKSEKDPRFYETYGDFWESMGFLAIAERTRKIGQGLRA